MSRPDSPPSWYGKLGMGLLSLLGAVLLGLIGFGLLHVGFEVLREYRQLERTPRSLAAAVLPGEVHLLGTVELAGDALQAPDSGTTAVYYRYHVEREHRDSDGDTEWRTVLDESEYTDFELRDDSGAILVQPGARVDFDAPERSRRREGDLRYTEYRIEPGDSVFVFAMIELDDDGSAVARFDSEGQYSPVISAFGAESVHGGMLVSTLLLIWGGLFVLSFAIYALLWGLRVHLAVLYLAVLSIAMAFVLVVLSVQTARDDLHDSFARTARDAAAASRAVADHLDAAGIDWNGEWSAVESLTRRLPADERRIVEHLHQRIAQQIERTQAIREHWPERWIAAGLGLPALPDPGAAEPLERDGAGEHDRSLIGGLIAALMLLIATALAWFGFRRLRLKRTIENLPTSRSAGVAWGLAELHGQVALDRGHPALTGPLSGRPCVWFHHVVQERRGSGNKARWVTIEDERVETRFRLVDAEGSVPVEPAGAEAIVSCSMSEHRGNRRYSEHWIEPGTTLYLLGSAEVDPDTGDSLRIARGAGDQPFLISDLGESVLLLRKARSALLLLNLGVNAGNAAALAMLGALLALHGAGFLMAALAPLGFLAVFLAILIYNDLVMLRQRVRRAWSNIEVSLLKRADLVPRLQTVLDAYLAHERQLQQRLAELRALSDRSALAPDAAAALIDSERQLLAGLRLLRESNPQLRGDAPATALMRSLSRLETEVALMREGYNQSVERYNTRCGHFPELLFARMFGFADASLLRSQAA